jgi:hypothetical protein
MKTNVFLSLGLVLVLSFSMQAQDYKSAIGGKLGYGLVASYKKFFSEKTGVDFYGGLHWSSGFIAGLNYSIHNNINEVENLRWYYGGGAVIASYAAGTELGVSGNIGLEYTFEEIPLNISVDYVPTINIIKPKNYDIFRGNYGALTARYILSR